MTKKERAEDRRAQILEAAARCFASKGFHLTTMDDVAAESGLSKGSLYWHFENKDDLLIELGRWYLSGFEQETARILQKPELDCEERLRQVFAMLGAGLQNTRDLLSVSLEFFAHSRNSQKMSDMLRDVYSAWFDDFETMFDDCIAQGVVREVNTRDLTAFVAAAFDGLMMQELFLGPVDWRSVSDTMLNVISAGILVEREN